MTPTTRRRAWAARPPRLPVLLTAPLLAVLVTSGVGAEPVGASVGTSPDSDSDSDRDGNGDGDAGLRILLDEVDPVVARPGQPVTLRGRLVNEGPDVSRLNLITVAAAMGPLTSRADVAGWVEGTDPRSASWVLGDDALGAVIPPGGQDEFEVTVPGSSLQFLPATPAMLGVELVASAEEETDRVPVPDGPAPAVLRTVLTTTGQPSVDVPLETTWLVPLTLPPDAELSSPDDTEHTAAWLAAVGQDSSVRQWLEHLTVPEVTWWVDPAALVAHQPAEALVVPGPEEDAEPTAPPAVSEPPEPTGPDDKTDETDESGQTGTPTPPEDMDRETAEPVTAQPTGTGPSAPSVPGRPDGDNDSDGDDDNDGEDSTASPEDGTDTGPAPAPPPETGPTSEPGPNPEPDPEPEPETLEEALAQLRLMLAEVDPQLLWWLPTDDPDLGLLVTETDAVPTAVADDLLTRLPEQAPPAVVQLLRQGRQNVAWPALAAPTASDVAAISDLYARTREGGLRAVLVPRESFTADSTAPPRLGAVPLGDSPDVVAIGADSWTSGLVAASGSDAEEHGAGAAAQRLLAHTLGTWLEAPASPRTLVIAPPRGAEVPAEVLDQLSEGWARAQWLSPVSAQEVLDRAEDADPVGLSGIAPEEEVLGPLSDLVVPSASPVLTSRARDLVRLQEDLDGLSQILRDTDALRSWEPVLDAQWSTRWRQDEDVWVSTWRTLRHEVASTRDAVYLLPSSVNFLADQGVIHLTVVNDLPVAVENVQLRLRPSNGRLQVTGQPDPVDVGPGSRASVPFQARSITRGETVLHVRITAPDGTPLGEDAEVNVRVQPTGVWIYWVLGGLAGLVLVLGLRRALTSSSRRTAYPGSSPAPGSEERPQ
ncbi:DUF6049 family protein [Ornithinimicrobium pratense]|uniref:Uncharacterized protein n=1 Tax=Ornithinimicrobium pratense TaxID=2593973 RepID=A0A5J6V8C7_9MICO|nr:DUF6049 family protein [Ornithinimicrobium pratense]QFG70038.1 hypothetical protein FY030_16150 [Ornithinimicrobium pratense]